MVNNDAHKETRLRFIPSGLANEVLLDAYLRLASFEPAVHSLKQRIFDGYAAEIARDDANHDGVVTASKPTWKAPPTAGNPTTGYTCRRPPTTGWPSPARSTTACCRPGSRPHNAPGYSAAPSPPSTHPLTRPSRKTATTANTPPRHPGPPHHSRGGPGCVGTKR
jgi:hypothetical protein